jgi:DNA-binding transcriptional LysR family regulator
MEIRHLRYFVAVAERAHFGRAADALHIAQPSLSKQVRQLEREIGVRLFERSTRQVRLTPAGEVFLAECRRILGQMTASIESARAVSQGQRGQLHIAFVSGAMGAGALPHLLHDFQELHPDVALRIRPMPALEQIDALREGTVHIGFFSAGYKDSAFEQLQLWRERLILAVPTRHRFAARPGLRYDDLEGERIVMYSRGSGSQLPNFIIAVLHERQVDPEIIHQGADAETIIGLVAAGRGISLVPASWSAFAFPGVTYREIAPERIIQPGMALTWYRRKESPLVAEFVSSVKRTLRENRAIKALEVSIME